MNLAQKIKTLPQRTFARILYSVKESPWWINYEKEMRFNEVDDRIERAKALLGPSTYGEIGMFDNTIKNLKVTSEVNKQPWTLSDNDLKTFVDVIQELKPLTSIVKMTSMSNPVCHFNLMRYQDTKPDKGMTMAILRTVVDAQSRKLRTRIHAGLIAQNTGEISRDFAKSVAGELMSAVVGKISEIAKPAPILQITDAANTTNELVHAIRNQVSDITADTNRSVGFFVLGHTDVMERLKSHPDFKGALGANKRDLVSELGKIDDNVSILASANVETDTLLVGYIADIVLDNGIVFMPYIPVIDTGVVIDPYTFEPVRGFITRYGFAEDSQSANYYRKIDISALTK